MGPRQIRHYQSIHRKRYPLTGAYNQTRLTRDYTPADKMRDELFSRIHFLEDRVAELQMYILQNQHPVEPVVIPHAFLGPCPKCGRDTYENDPHICVYRDGLSA